jgi:thiol-disulfide isomerase/thioredoxin
MRGAGTQRSLIRLTGLCLGAILSALPADVRGAAPANDNFANATVLTGITNFVISANAGATPEPGERDHADSTCSNSVWWTWQAPFTGSVGISTAGSTFDTLLAVYTGDSVSNLQVVADNDDDAAGGFGIVTSSLVFRALAGETYRIAVDGFNGATGVVRFAIGRAGYPAPFWSLVDLNSNIVNSTDFRPQVLVIDFWGTICGACVDELPVLIRLQQNLSPEGFTLFGVSKDVKTADVRDFVRSNNIPYGIAMRTDPMENAFGGNVPLPTKFIIDRENMVVGMYIGGSVKYNFYEKLVKPLLRGSKEVQLQIRQQGGALRLAWPATEFGYNLESTTALGGSNWTVASSQVVVTNDQNTVTVPAGPDAKFFRLRKTPVY